jgi:hypothetical protein
MVVRSIFKPSKSTVSLPRFAHNPSAGLRRILLYFHLHSIFYQTTNIVHKRFTADSQAF